MNQLTLDLQPADSSYRIIELTQGQVTLVDTEDYERAAAHSWSAHWDPKARQFNARGAIKVAGKFKGITLHRFLMDAPKGIEVDHANGDTLDNRRKTNLRFATHAQNCKNRRKKSDNTSGAKGVHWNKELRKWRARIMADGKRVLIGDFADLEAARAAYNRRATELHGAFARHA